MDITIGITISDDLKSGAVERSKELMLKDLVQNNGVVMSAVILTPHHIGPSHLHDSGIGYTPDEKTRQSR